MYQGYLKVIQGLTEYTLVNAWTDDHAHVSEYIRHYLGSIQGLADWEIYR